MMWAWWAHPWALLAALAIPVLLGVYLLRARAQQHVMPSVLVWRMLVQTHVSGRRPVWQRIPWIALLESVIIMLLVLAAAGIRVPRMRAAAAQVVVLDDSASMRAPGLRGASAYAAALDACEHLLEYEHGARSMAVLAGSTLRMLPNTVFSRTILERAWRCRAPRAALDDALALALRVAGSNGLVHVFTDAMPSNHVPGRVAWHAFGVPSDNCAIVFAGRARGATNDVCALDIANYSTRDVAVPVEIRSGTNAVVMRRAVTLAAGAAGRMVHQIPRHLPVTFSVPPDALPDDNTVTLLPEPARVVRVQLDVPEPSRASIVRALRASGMARVVASAPHLLITTNATPTLRDACWCVRLHTGPRGAALAGPFLIAGAHPVCEGLAVQQAVWGIVTNHLAGFPLIAARGVPVLTLEHSAQETPQLHLQWMPSFSTVDTMPAWPVLWHNILRWRRAALPGISQRHVPLGETVQAHVPPSAASVVVCDSEGNSMPVTRMGGSVIIEPEQAGIYRVHAGEWHDVYAVNFLAPRESDLRTRAAGEFGVSTAARVQQMQFASYAWLSALAALALLGVHQWWLARAGGAPE